MSAPRFQIVHRPIAESPGILLHRATTHDQATLSYHNELGRLRREQAYGELAMLRINGERQTLLRESIRLPGVANGRDPDDRRTAEASRTQSPRSPASLPEGQRSLTR
jgi:hypothetical protein